jgi:hypothetical protein
VAWTPAASKKQATLLECVCAAYYAILTEMFVVLWQGISNAFANGDRKSAKQFLVRYKYVRRILQAIDRKKDNLQGPPADSTN